MIKQKIGNCFGKDGRYPHCGATDVPIVGSRGQCIKCSEKWKKKQKEDKQRAKFGKVMKEGELFAKVWAKRPHKCEHCGRLLQYFRHEYFDHIKPKGSHPELKFEESNIQILCHYWDEGKGGYTGCHSVKHFGTKKQWDELKDSYNNV